MCTASNMVLVSACHARNPISSSTIANLWSWHVTAPTGAASINSLNQTVDCMIYQQSTMICQQ